MTEREKYLFDLNGYIVIPGVLDTETVAQMWDEMSAHGIEAPENNPGRSRFGNFLSWGPLWWSLIDHPTILPYLDALIGCKFRLDHAYGMAAAKDGEAGGFGMHHDSHMFHHGCYYTFEKGRMHNGLIVVSWMLTDTPPGGGGFICIPGSHKANYPTPPDAYAADSPLAVNVPGNAGDVLIFSEALTHGTARWTQDVERRSVLLKYCPHYMQWAKAPMSAEVDGLSERQRLILSGARVWDRAPVITDDA
jgi:hypothetical protein